MQYWTVQTLNGQNKKCSRKKSVVKYRKKQTDFCWKTIDYWLLKDYCINKCVKINLSNLSKLKTWEVLFPTTLSQLSYIFPSEVWRNDSYLIFVRNVRNAVSVKFLAECKKIPEKRENYCFGQICRKFTHFPSVKFPGLKMCECRKNDKYQVCRSFWNLLWYYQIIWLYSLCFWHHETL